MTMEWRRTRREGLLRGAARAGAGVVALPGCLHPKKLSSQGPLLPVRPVPVDRGEGSVSAVVMEFWKQDGRSAVSDDELETLKEAHAVPLPVKFLSLPFHSLLSGVSAIFLS